MITSILFCVNSTKFLCLKCGRIYNSTLFRDLYVCPKLHDCMKFKLHFILIKSVKKIA